MALWRKRTLEHSWLPASGVLETDQIQVVALAPELDTGYFAVLDEGFMAVHHWPQWMHDHLQRGMAATKRTRHQLTKETALLVLADEPTTVAGFVSVQRPGIGNEPFHIGLQLRADFRGLGIVSGLLPPLVDQLNDVGYTQVALSTSEENRAMVRVCEKLGYSYELVQYRHPDGEVETARQYTVLPR